MKNKPEEIQLTEADIEEIPELPEDLLEEEESEPSLEELVKQGERSIKEAEKSAKEIEQKGEIRIETVTENIGVFPRQIERTKKDISFGERKTEIIKKIQTLFEETREKIRNLFEKEEKGPFDPVEEYKKVQKIMESHIDVKEKKQAIKEYKREVVKQKEGIAQLQDNLRKSIEKNPNISTEEMMRVVESRAPGLRLVEKQKDFFKDLIGSYQEKHQAVKSAREEYTDDKELFKACFGFEPQGGVKIEQGPISLYFKCSDPEDFVNIGVEHNKNLGRAMSEEAKKIMKTFHGASFSFALIPELKESIILENSREVKNTKETQKHEEQHKVYKLFEQKKSRKDAEEELKIAKTEQDRKKALAEYLRSFREEYILEEASKDEILAFYKAGKKLGDILNTLARRKEEKGSYDFFVTYRDTFLKDKIKNFSFEDRIANEVMEEVFRNEYEKILIKSMHALKDLEKMGKSRDEIVELLIKEPLEQWSNVVRHMKQIRADR